MEGNKPGITKKKLDELTYKVIGAAIEVQKQGLRSRTELVVPVIYKGVDIMADLRCDVLVEECLVVELKTVEKILPIHRAQLMSYMTLLKAPKGILINFNSLNIFQLGQETFVNDFYKDLPGE